ncbi:MAG: hypothetical protein EXS31_07745 [Pedosphaera sp.]|nr:hypothetical protein [Pedosphaera sp.]
MSFACGCLFGLSLLKFGNPIVLDKLIESPVGIWELIFSPWPVRWGQIGLVALIAACLPIARFRPPKPVWLFLLPVLWFGWQVLSSVTTVDASLTRITIIHFATCLFAFGLGLFVLGPRGKLLQFAVGVLPFFVWVLWTGFDQHYGGLDATEKMIKETPNWREIYPPEYLERIAKKRIFGTLVYPNALAGAILLWLPVLVGCIWRIGDRLTLASRVVLIGTLIYGGGACLFWSGSKSGWLIALGLVLVALCHVGISRKFKTVIIFIVFLVGLAGFSWKFASYFKAGATSVGARVQYWRAAWITSLEHPVVGTGPGTFARAYAKIRPPDAEMAHLTHNDYLEQASDSGFPGMVCYTSFWVGLISLARYRPISSVGDVRFCIWLGLLGWVVQGVSEFGLYIPALAWPAFALAGWMSTGNGHGQDLEPQITSKPPG